MPRTTIIPELMREYKDAIERCVTRFFILPLPFWPQPQPSTLITYSSADVGFDDKLRLRFIRLNTRTWFKKKIHLVMIRATTYDQKIWDRLHDWLDKDEIGYWIFDDGAKKIYPPTHLYYGAHTESVRSYRLLRNLINDRREEVRKGLENITEEKNKAEWDKLKELEDKLRVAGINLENQRRDMLP